MNWQQKLRHLEKERRWDEALELLSQVIDREKSVGAYIYTIYFLMNLLVEEDYDENKHDYYAAYLKKYFDESFVLFADNPDYLYYVGMTAVMSEWYLGVSVEEYKNMIRKARDLDPDNLVYTFNFLWEVYADDLTHQRVIRYAKMVLERDSFVREILKQKGACGDYVLELIENSCKRVLGLR